jgi:hypothetical protein
VAERLAAEGRPPGQALGALAATDEEVARRLDAYRRFRSTWRLAAGPPEGEGALLFLEARRSLEAAEARLGQALPGPGAPGARLDPVAARTGMAAAVGRAREASGRVDPERRAAARRFVDAQERALQEMIGLASSPADPRERARRALAYQAAKAEVLDAVAEWSRLTAAR